MERKPLSEMWLKRQCPVCGRVYKYLPDYQPKTCNRAECLHAFHHKLAPHKWAIPIQP